MLSIRIMGFPDHHIHLQPDSETLSLIVCCLPALGWVLQRVQYRGGADGGGRGKPSWGLKSRVQPVFSRASQGQSSGGACRTSVIPHPGEPELPPGFWRVDTSLCPPQASLVAQTVKNPPAMQEIWVPSLGREDPLEKGMATHSNILAWRIPWMEASVHGVTETDTTERLILSVSPTASLRQRAFPDRWCLVGVLTLFCPDTVAWLMGVGGGQPGFPFAAKIAE